MCRGLYQCYIFQDLVPQAHEVSLLVTLILYYLIQFLTTLILSFGVFFRLGFKMLVSTVVSALMFLGIVVFGE